MEMMNWVSSNVLRKWKKSKALKSVYCLVEKNSPKKNLPFKVTLLLFLTISRRLLTHSTMICI
ncbi:hypothetical protein EFB08_14390 [Rufibacter latericius]|uniref:Uncharacterized protein n=1 Tax=Rufibacter latericius TaxID=2487040 RepID=A0A3M9MLC9_9BACT|nr:hypothetical protein EFB08_14390 [Rufibacter latericius]